MIKFIKELFKSKATKEKEHLDALAAQRKSDLAFHKWRSNLVCMEANSNAVSDAAAFEDKYYVHLSVGDNGAINKKRAVNPLHPDWESLHAELEGEA